MKKNKIKEIHFSITCDGYNLLKKRCANYNKKSAF